MFEIFNVAQTMRDRTTKDLLLDNLLRVLFSTRTARGIAAMQRLGGRVIYMDETSFPVTKGETLEDSILVMAGCSDVVVLRYPESGAVSKAAHICRKPLINAGDGIGEHPTQALLDIFTIRKEIGTEWSAHYYGGGFAAWQDGALWHTFLLRRGQFAGVDRHGHRQTIGSGRHGQINY
ncbi:hypothetical protein pipiens_017282 [Culex pipiens pipiens]|uniref:Aspartate/ornithine carbamoyltransferase carbamoyl-P binding domain-containing protein n=1 Tax=Culex pipiens pipiens TaxID=38569 RepID=A0ABD1CHA8_CULPP